MADTADNLPFLVKDGDFFVPQPHARSPWAAQMLHGRLVGGLIARTLELEHRDPDLHFARLTVDLFRSSPLVPLRVSTTRVRDGGRIRVADAVVETEQGAIGRAGAVLLRRGEQPPGEVWAPPAWDAPPVEPLAPPPTPYNGWIPPFDLWRLTPWGSKERSRIWLRERHPLVGGEQLTPFVRAVLAAEFVSPLTHMGTEGLRFINADYTLFLSRLPIGDVIGMESDGHLSDAGVAVGHCTLYDDSGPIGYCATSAVANSMAIPPA
ncbi:acyl-CoA thioesterase domain-containing protein [Thermopolyspora sp. NPDC052614]|uniref:acyl-CoA thioesterase domain-containing protein n=1 Tax=Thermopolyspora sp. NPDC052614 TaxID=3155682 RepID=UPI0034394A3E